MAFVLIEHRVGDFEAFRAAYLDDADRRRRFGSQGGRVFRASDDPEVVIVLLQWDTEDRARDFARSLEVHQAAEWAAGGVSTTRVLVLGPALDSPV